MSTFRLEDVTLRHVIDWFSFDDVLSTLVCLCILFRVGVMMVGENVTIRHAAKATAIAALCGHAVLTVLVREASTVTEFGSILLHSLLVAAWAYVVALVVFPISHFIYRRTLGAALVRVATSSAEWDRKVQVARQQRQTDRLAQEQAKRIAEERKQSDLEARTRSEEAALEERGRASRVEEARNEVCEFYKSHETDLAESLPAALFRSKLATAFPVTISPQDAWKSAELLISEMLPLLGSAVSKKREKEQAREEQEAAARESHHQRQAIARLTEWRNEQRAILQASLPERTQLIVALQELDDRFDQLLKESIKETRP